MSKPINNNSCSNILKNIKNYHNFKLLWSLMAFCLRLTRLEWKSLKWAKLVAWQPIICLKLQNRQIKSKRLSNNYWHQVIKILMICWNNLRIATKTKFSTWLIKSKQKSKMIPSCRKLHTLHAFKTSSIPISSSTEISDLLSWPTTTNWINRFPISSSYMLVCLWLTKNYFYSNTKQFITLYM